MPSKRTLYSNQHVLSALSSPIATRHSIVKSIVCVVVNTGTFLLGMGLFFADVLAVWSAGGNILLYMISGIVLINMVPELILNVVFSPVAERIYRVVKK